MFVVNSLPVAIMFCYSSGTVKTRIPSRTPKDYQLTPESGRFRRSFYATQGRSSRKRIGYLSGSGGSTPLALGMMFGLTAFYHIGTQETQKRKSTSARFTSIRLNDVSPCGRTQAIRF